MSRLHKVDAQKFKELKEALRTGTKRTTIANRNGVSVETLRKVKNAKTFLEYRANNEKSHTPPTPGTVISPTKGSTPSKSTPTVKPTQDKRGFWARLFNI